MLSLESANTLARYNRWMNDKLYEVTASLSDDVRKKDLGAFFKSIHGTLNHLLVADKIWLGRFKGEAVPQGFFGPDGIRSLDHEFHESFEDLRRERQQTDATLSGWVAGLTQEQLEGPLVYLRRGARLETPLWWAVAHVFNHQTHHRGQLTTLLTQQGCDPGVTDLFAMLREEQSS